MFACQIPLSSFKFFRSPAIGPYDLTIFLPRSRSGELLGKFETLFSPFGNSNSSDLPSSLFAVADVGLAFRLGRSVYCSLALLWG